MSDYYDMSKYLVWVPLFILIVIALVGIYICCETYGRPVAIVQEVPCTPVSPKISCPPEEKLTSTNLDDDDADYIEFTMKGVFELEPEAEVHV